MPMKYKKIYLIFHGWLLILSVLAVFTIIICFLMKQKEYVILLLHILNWLIGFILNVTKMLMRICNLHHWNSE